MEIKGYFQKIRSVEQTLPADCVVVASLATPDGGREGRFMDLSRSLAAKMIVDRKARLATEEEARAHREELQKETEDANARVQAARPAFLVDLAETRRTGTRKKS